MIYNILVDVLYFIPVIIVVVLVHELGHYFVAKKCGVKILEFALGFGTKVVGFKRKNGEIWKICLFPLGGYVKMFGDDNASGAFGYKPNPSDEEINYSLTYKSPFKKILVAFAGPFMNILLAFVLFASIFVFKGQPNVEPVIMRVSKNSLAERMNLRVNDRIVSINNNKVGYFNDIAVIMQKVAINKKNAKQEIMIKVIRNNRSITLTDKIGNDVLLGVGGGLMTYKKVSFVDAIKLSLHEVLSLTKMTYVGLWNAVVHKQTKSIGGPVMIAKESARAGKQGICMFAYFIALISISLGAINLIPIPLLDGGHILFSAIEGITRKRLPNIVYKIALYLGIGVLSLLMGLGFLNDLFLR